MNKALSMLGLAERAGRIRSGSFQTEEAIRSGKARLVILAEDAGENTAGALKNKCDYYDVPLRIFGESGQLGHAIGREKRVCIAITDEGFADTVLRLIDSENKERGSNGENEDK